MLLQDVLLFQAIYYFPSALWAIVHIKSFEEVTGSKTDRWLVYTVSSLLLSSSLVFFYSGFRKENVPIETIILSISNCLSLILIDVIFVTRRIIKRIYLLDALVELGIILCLVYSKIG